MEMFDSITLETAYSVIDDEHLYRLDVNTSNDGALTQRHITLRSTMTAEEVAKSLRALADAICPASL